MRQGIFAYRNLGWWLLAAAVRTAAMFFMLAIGLAGVGDTSPVWWLLLEGNLPYLSFGLVHVVVFLDTLLVGYGIGVVLNIRQRNRMKLHAASSDEAAWPPSPNAPQP